MLTYYNSFLVLLSFSLSKLFSIEYEKNYTQEQ